MTVHNQKESATPKVVVTRGVTEARLVRLRGRMSVRAYEGTVRFRDRNGRTMIQAC